MKKYFDLFKGYGCIIWLRLRYIFWFKIVTNKTRINFYIPTKLFAIVRILNNLRPNFHSQTFIKQIRSNNSLVFFTRKQLCSIITRVRFPCLLFWINLSHPGYPTRRVNLVSGLTAAHNFRVVWRAKEFFGDENVPR